MLKKLLTGGLAAGAMAVPLAGLAWADPVPNPTPPAPGVNGQGPTMPGQPAVPSSNGQNPTCIVSANTPAPLPSAPGASVQGAANSDWQQVATLQGSVASNLGLPPGQVVKVFCAPAGVQNPQGQPTGFENGGQPGTQLPGQPGAQNPWQPGQQPSAEQTGPQNPAPGQQ